MPQQKKNRNTYEFGFNLIPQEHKEHTAGENPIAHTCTHTHTPSKHRHNFPRNTCITFFSPPHQTVADEHWSNPLVVKEPEDLRTSTIFPAVPTTNDTDITSIKTKNAHRYKPIRTATAHQKRRQSSYFRRSSKSSSTQAAAEPCLENGGDRASGKTVAERGGGGSGESFTGHF